MKIHIEVLLSKIEEIEKKYSKDLIMIEQRIKEMQRDKTRVEELLGMREEEVNKLRLEKVTLQALLDKKKQVIATHEGQIKSLRKELVDSDKRKSGSGADKKSIKARLA